MGTGPLNPAESPPEGNSHPNVTRLLTYCHRSLAAEERLTLQRHLGTCASCRERLKRMQVTIALFRGAQAWRTRCPEASQLFRLAGQELGDEEQHRLTAHLADCFSCRETVLVFRDVLQAARMGRVSLLVQTRRQRLAYVLARGPKVFLRQLIGRPATRRALAVGVPLLLMPIPFLLKQAPEAPVAPAQQAVPADRSQLVMASPDHDPVGQPTPAPELSLTDRLGRALGHSRGPRVQYLFQYAEDQPLAQVEGEPPLVRWATGMIDGTDGDSSYFRLGQPPGKEGLVALRPEKPLTVETLAQVKTILAQALTPTNRENVEVWCQARADLQQRIHGEVWLLERPILEASLARGP